MEEYKRVRSLTPGTWYRVRFRHLLVMLLPPCVDGIRVARTLKESEYSKIDQLWYHEYRRDSTHMYAWIPGINRYVSISALSDRVYAVDDEERLLLELAYPDLMPPLD